MKKNKKKKEKEIIMLKVGVRDICAEKNAGKLRIITYTHTSAQKTHTFTRDGNSRSISMNPREKKAKK